MSGQGPGAVVPAPPISPPTVSLLSTVNVIEDSDLRWENGITWAPENCGDGQIVTLCGGDEKTVADSAAAQEWTPYGVVASDRCSTFGFKEHDYRGRATRRLLACQSKMIAHELWTAQFEISNSSFLADGTDPVAAQPVSTALAVMEQLLADCGCGQRMMIHMRPKLFEVLNSNTYALRREGNRWLTGMDNIIVPDAGYPGTAPGSATDAALSATAATEWMIGTPMVDVRLGPIEVIPNTMGEAVERTTNTVTYYAERVAIAAYDNCCVIGVEVTAPVA